VVNDLAEGVADMEKAANVMTASPMMEPCRLCARAMGADQPDLLRELVNTFVTTQMSADPEAVSASTPNLGR
jgi:hypothetical protein